MKRIFLILFAVLLTGGMTLQAGPVSADRALEVAKKALPQPATKTSGDLKLIWNGENAATKAAGQPAFYVFGRDAGGFVIIAGDDNVQPVLAISETNEFKVEGMPENVKWWMDNMKYYVRNMLPTQQVREQWAQFAETKSGPLPETVTNKVEKLTATWDQGNNDPVYFGEGQYIFNAMCPLDLNGTDLSITGCVAVALGEVITYQSGQDGVTMPTSGSGDVGGYSVGDGYVAPAAYTLGTVYDWANLRTLMTIDDVKDAKTAGKTALLANLGQLLADLGAMAKASYSANGTGASTNNAISGLMTHMGFNKGAYLALASSYSPREWISKLKTELDVRPLIYSGQTAGRAGHSFVFDGYGKYGTDDVFHVNFGWGGMCNGYYYFTNLDAGGGHDYSYVGEAFFDFYPKAESSYTYALQFDNSYVGVPGLAYDDPFSPTARFVITLGLKNVGTTTYSGKLAAKLVAKDGTPKYDFDIYINPGLGWTDEVTVSGVVYKQLYIELPSESTVQFGDKIVIYCTTDAEKSLGSLAPVRHRLDGAVVNELPVMPAAFIKVNPLGYSVNDYFQLQLANYDYAYDATEWTITNMSGGAPVVKQQSDWEYQFTQAGTYKIEAAVAPYGGAVVETIVTYVVVGD